jgi:hypothetical protein
MEYPDSCTVAHTPLIQSFSSPPPPPLPLFAYVILMIKHDETLLVDDV